MCYVLCATCYNTTHSRVCSQSGCNRYEFSSDPALRKIQSPEDYLKPSMKKKGLRPRFDVLVTSYENALADDLQLRSVEWECMIIDEGHRLKSRESKLYAVLQTYDAAHRVLLTGTPLQNNLEELYNLMHFLAPRLCAYSYQLSPLSLLCDAGSSTRLQITQHF